MLDLGKLSWGSCTTQEAHVLIEPPADDTGLTKPGFLRGPFSAYANTLTADFPFRQVSHPTVRAGSRAALVTEPCYWTPKLPFLYQVHFVSSESPNPQASRWTGAKRFVARDSSLFLENRRIVLRGMQTHGLFESDLLAARDAEVALMVPEPPLEICDRASHLGVPLLVDLTKAGDRVATYLDASAWYPALMMLIVNRVQLQSLADLPRHQSLVAVHVRPGDPPLSEHCDLLVVDVMVDELPAWIDDLSLPLLALAPLPEVEIAKARDECDRLQARLAPRYDLAGYFV